MSITENKEQEWFEIPGFNGVYSINAKGDVKNNGIRPHKTGRKPSGRILKATINAEGYWWIPLRGHIDRMKQRSYSIHRLLAITFIPNPDNKPCINHKNSIRSDNSLENLEWCTFSENNSHAHRVGGQRKYIGQRHNQARLSDSQVIEIRKTFQKRKRMMPDFMKNYGVSKGCITAIVDNKTWKHLL